MRHITEEEVRAALPMPRAIELVEEAFRRLDDGRAVNLPRRRLSLENRAMLHDLPAGDSVSNLVGAKLYVTSRGGTRFVYVLFDSASAELLAVIDADSLGQIRTGAATGLATRLLSAPGAATAAVIGSGYQAETQLEAIAAVRRLERVRVFSRREENRKAFADRMSRRLGVAVDAVDSAEEAVRGALIVATITSSRDPVLLGDWLEPGCHVNAAGSNHVKRRELDGVAIERAGLIAADSVEQAKLEAGDLVQAAEEGRLEWNRVQEFSAVVSGKVRRSSPDEVTLFESQGIGLEDLAVAEHVWRTIGG